MKPKRIKIGVDATTWQNKRGYGRFTRALLNAMVQQNPDIHYVFFVDTHQEMDTMPSGVEIRIVEASSPTSVAASAEGSRSISDMLRMGKALSSKEFDLLLFPTVYSYVPVCTAAKKIVIIHDVIVERFPELTLPNPRSRLFWHAKVALARSQADVIVTVSEYSKQGIAETLKIPANRISIIGEASDPAFRIIEGLKTTHRLNDLGFIEKGTYIVYLGGFGPHKNLDMLVDCFAELVSTEDDKNIHLVLVGEYENEVFHSSANDLKRLIDRHNLNDRVIFTGYLPDEDLVVLLNLSTVLVLPSLIEGFGLPAIEAAACGCPVIATKESPLPDLLGEGGIYIDPLDPGQLEQALRTILESTEVQNQMRQAGLQAIRNLTWDSSAQKMLAIIQQVLD